MSELELKKKKKYPSIVELEKEIDESFREDEERERKERIMRQMLYSEEPAERIAVKAVAAGLLSYVNYEELRYFSYYSHRKGFFGRTTDEERHEKRIKRIIAER